MKSLQFALLATCMSAGSAFAQESPEEQETGVTAPFSLPAAPDTQAAAEKDILVEAPPTLNERKRELKKMISSLLRNPRSGRTLGTFFDAPCPKVFGLPPEAAEAIRQRILLNAKQLDANRRNPRENCKHNISVIFVPSGKGPAQDWFDIDSEVLKHLLSYERVRVIEEDGPVRAWSYDAVRSHDGFLLPDRTGRRLNQLARFANRVPFATRLKSQATAEIGGSVVMIELESANGKTLNQLADYATMRALANLGGIDPETAPAASTILTLFQDGEDAPQELTSFDRSFLTKLYSLPRNTLENRYYSSIAASVANNEKSAGVTSLSTTPKP